MTTLTSAYSDASWLRRALVSARPIICPLEPILACIPSGATVLDVGCGVGASLLSMSLQGKISSGTGCDANSTAISIAKKAASHITGTDLQFHISNTIEEIPYGPFDVVTLIDVMHHVIPPEQQQFFAACVDRLRAGGVFIYKDMVDRPLWRNLFNRFHDIIIARQIIHYVPLESVKDWGSNYGLCLEKESSYSRFAYGHELLVFHKVQYQNKGLLC